MAVWGKIWKGALLTTVLGIALLMIVPAGSALNAASISVAAAAESSPTAIATGAAPTTATPAQIPLSPTTPPSGSPLLSQIPAALEKVPWIASLTHSGPSLHPLASVPDLALLEHPATPDAQGVIDPFYVAQPAPLGIGDFGLGATPYSYNTSHILGEVTFNTPPNVTDPGSSGVIEPVGEHDGYVGNFYEFGIQLNTVATNMSIPGSDQGFFWTQNVVNFNATGIHFVDDTFNMTGLPEIYPGTIYSACNNNSVGVQRILTAYGGVLQCVGGTVPISPASYPITVQLYNNATVTAGNRTGVSYGYRFILAGTNQVFTGVASDVIFNNPSASTSRPANPPGFSIDGFAGAPGGVFRDAEMVLVGNIGGDNSVFRSIHGTMDLEYSNQTHGGWQSVPSAYNFGSDTGETSTGIADYWTPSHTLVINQGPAMLYGLWNAVPNVSVASGSIHIAGSISPSYGFVFVSNTRPAIDPWNSSLGERDNMSWLPTNNAGSFSTYLPPLGKPWTTSYRVEAFADGYAPMKGPSITGPVSSYTLTLTPAPGTLNAPLYAFSNAQESALALHVTGSSHAPYAYSDLTVNMNLTFEHVNDYGYPEFVVFMAQDVSNPIRLNAVYQGQDSPAGNFAFTDYAIPPATGLLAPPPFTFEAPYYTSGINIFGGAHDQISNQILAEDGYNLQVDLWGDLDASVWNITSTYGSPGVFVGESTDSLVWNVAASAGADGLTDMGSSYTTAWDIAANGTGTFGVYALSSHFGTFSAIDASNGAFGLVTGAFDNAATAPSPYYWLPGANGLSATDFVAYNESWGANVSLSVESSISDFSASISSVGVIFAHSDHANASDVYASTGSIGVSTLVSRDIDVKQVDAVAASVGVWAVDSSVLHVSDVTDRDHSVGVELVEASYANVHGVTAVKYSVGVILDGATHVTLTDIQTRDHSVAVEVL